VYAYRRHDATACAQNSTRNKRAISGTYRTIILGSRGAGVRACIDGLYLGSLHSYSYSYSFSERLSERGTKEWSIGRWLEKLLSLSLFLSRLTLRYGQLVISFVEYEKPGDGLASTVIRHASVLPGYYEYRCIESRCISRYHRLRVVVDADAMVESKRRFEPTTENLCHVSGIPEFLAPP